MIGRSLNQYRITGSIGAGGMGEVFRARDSRLNRDVAMKVLPKDFANDADRLRRFEQEAKTLASLNHPNILIIHDAGLHEGAPFLVSELLEGKTLREEMNGAALPVRRAIEYALQITHGLAAAHARGIIHRDLKPENVFITKDSRVKILDFGLAKSSSAGAEVTRLTSSSAEQNQSLVTSTATKANAPTLLQSTVPGLILGTPAYMAPEQVRGDPADHRCDIFAFGCVLYEMLGGSPPFARNSAVGSMNAVLSEDPPELSEIVPQLPAGLLRLIHRCLEKQLERRFQTAADLAFALESLGTASTTTARQEHGKWLSPRAFFWAFAAAVIVIIAATLWIKRDPRPQTTLVESPLRKVELLLRTPTNTFENPNPDFLAISPDGRKLAYVNGGGLWIQPLDRFDVPLLISSGTKVSAPFWSPDGNDIGWFEDQSLRRVAASGGRAFILCGTERLRRNSGEGAAWMSDGEIIFASGASGLFRVSARGGKSQEILSPAKGERDFHSPAPWPDGKRVVFVVHREVDGIEQIDTFALWNPQEPQAAKKILLQTNIYAHHPFVSATGHLLFKPNWQYLAALPISLKTGDVLGQWFRLADSGFSPTVSRDGTLALASRVDFRSFRQLIWVDRKGRMSPPISEAADLRHARISPDGSQIVFSAFSDKDRAMWLWLVDSVSTTGSALPLRPDPDAGPEYEPFWLPDRSGIAFTSWSTNADDLRVFTRALDGGTRQMSTIGTLLHLSSSGEYAFVQRGSRKRNLTNIYMRMRADKSETLLPGNLVNAESPSFCLSPDNAVLAYESNETGDDEIWAVAFPSFINRVLVSRGKGGLHPLWSYDGRELFFLSKDRTAIVAAPLINQTPPRFGEPAKLFDLPVRDLDENTLCDVSRDGQRFLMLQRVINSNAPAPKVLLIENWAQEYRERK
jgi:serine/threonine protein kinase